MNTSSLAARVCARPILVVEDDDAIRRLICEVLEQRGYAVVPAVDGRDAIRAAASHDFDLIVTNILMPGMSGPELVLRLRSERPEVKVIFITGYPGDAALNSGCAKLSFISKPFRLTDLITRVEHLLWRGDSA